MRRNDTDETVRDKMVRDETVGDETVGDEMDGGRNDQIPLGCLCQSKKHL